MTHPYATHAYADASSGRDEVFFSDALGAWLRIRKIPGSDRFDACGLYPFSCDLRQTTRSALADELSARGLVSLVFVTDPFVDDLDWTGGLDIARNYKAHHVIDQAEGPVHFTKHHRQEVRRAQRRCEARPIKLRDHLGQWRQLYDYLVDRRQMGPTHLFSDRYFHSLCDDGGFVSFAAFVEDRMVSCHIWVRHGSHAYSHLAASSEEGYRCGAAYAVYDCAIACFAECRLIDLGGAPDSGNGTGLDAFKRGFSNDTRTNMICGVVADQRAYDDLCSEHGHQVSGSAYFPLYRAVG